jgi:hypothetical protein
VLSSDVQFVCDMQALSGLPSSKLSRLYPLFPATLGSDVVIECSSVFSMIG